MKGDDLMLKLIKYLKNSVVSILLIVGLLVIQAVCDLSLPDYTSNIVNIGIQQGGVKNAAPDIIRKSEFDKLLLFVKNEDKDRVEKSYKLLDKDTLSQSEYDKEVKEYPALSNEPLYKLDVKDKEKIEELNLIVSKPILILSGIEKSKENNDDNKDMGFGMGESINIPDGVDIITLFKRMPKEQLDSIKNDMYEKLKDIPDSIAIQSAVSYVKDEYNAIGINTDRIQSNYILYSGGIMVAIALVSMAATVTVGYLGARVAAKLGRDLRGKVFRKVVSFSNTELDKFSTASLITRSTNDIQQIQMLMVMLLRVVFYAPILGLGGIIRFLIQIHLWHG